MHEGTGEHASDVFTYTYTQVYTYLFKDGLRPAVNDLIT